jgi:hypothetical protein
MSFFRTDSFVNITDFGIGQDPVQIYTIVPPTSDRPYCAITHYDLIEIYRTMAPSNTPESFAGVLKSENCPAASANCLWVDIYSTDFIMNVKFKVRATWNNDANLRWTSEVVTIGVNCGLSNNVMTQNFTDQNRTFWLNHTVENQFYFEPFSCTYDPVCCETITYTMTYDNLT